MSAARLPYEKPTLRAVTPAMVAVMSCLALLKGLHPDEYRYMAAFREGHATQTANFRGGDLDAPRDFVKRNAELNLYAGVATRVDAVGRGSQHLGALHALFVDLDFKDQPEDLARARLAAFPLRPSAVVSSGNGLHAYWLLREPIRLQDRALPQAKLYLRALATRLGGDLAAAEPARILRLPGTLNYKYDPPRPVVLEHLVQERHDLADLLAALPPVAEPAEQPRKPVAHDLTLEDRKAVAARWLGKQPPAVQGQGGDSHTYATACAVVIDHDLDAESALAVLADWNSRCVPPWTDYDLRAKVHSAELYATGQRGSKLLSRNLRVTWASDIKPQAVRWLWEQRMPEGSLVLLAGREGIGKTTLAYTVAADITRGRLPGQCCGQPRAVLVAATEDSWEHTIAPRLIGAGADLHRVARVEVDAAEGAAELVLPKDVAALGSLVRELDAALIILDPIISRLAKTIDTHKDAEVRSALEPVVKLAQDTGACVLGIIHVNKGASRDPLTMVMGSRAFVATPRAVLFVAQDPDDENVRLLGQVKNNLGRGDLPMLSFRIESVTVGETDSGPITTGKLVWAGESERSMRDVVSEAADGGADRPALDAATGWLEDFMASQRSGWAPSTDIKREARKAGHSERVLKRAAARLRLAAKSFGFPRKTVWALPGAAVQEVLDQGGTTTTTEDM